MSLEANWFEEINEWEDLVLKEELTRGILHCRFLKPSGAQKLVVKPMIDGRDVLGHIWQQRGCTTALAIGVLQKINTTLNACQAIILTPCATTASIAAQSIADLGSYLNASSNLRKEHIYSNSIDVTSPIHVLIGKPDYIWEILQRNTIDVQHLTLFIMEDADTVLERYEPMVVNILERLPEGAQRCFFSTTLRSDTLEFITSMASPAAACIRLPPFVDRSRRMRHYYVDLGQYKAEGLCLFLETDFPQTQALIYCNSLSQAESLTIYLRQEGYPASLLRNDVESDQRDALLHEFRSGSTRLLVSTTWGDRSDILHNCDDGYKVPLIFNFDFPTIPDYWYRACSVGGFSVPTVMISFGNLHQDEYLKAMCELQIDMYELPLKTENLLEFNDDN